MDMKRTRHTPEQIVRKLCEDDGFYLKIMTSVLTHSDPTSMCQVFSRGTLLHSQHPDCAPNVLHFCMSGCIFS